MILERLHYRFLGVIVGFCFLFLGCEDKETSADATDTQVTSEENDPNALRKGLFEKVLTSQSGIDFSNNLEEDVSSIENLFDFDYFYNGAGVGIEDINNDGLNDIFFAGNQVENKLYLNKGDFVFEDISEQAGINTGKVWSNGVTFVDINNDGFMDIYVSQGGPKRDYDRSNLLFINQGDLTFKESATELGLNDNGISTQSVFFDYDKDGDLDCFVSNENEFYGLDPITFFNQMKVKKESLDKSSGHLYENRNGKFINVTEQAGVLNASFGLGVSVSDINDDGWLDIYVANDYYVPDAMYINNKNGTFSNKIKEHTNQVSFFGMGVDVADINNDAMQDIFVLDMASSDHIRSKTLMASMDVDRFSLLVDRFEMPHQYMFNSLQLNVGNNQFHNISQLSKVAKTDWSWAGLLVDFDLDGRKDIYVTNGYRRYALDNDSQMMVAQAKQAYNGNVPAEIKQKLYDALPSEKLSNILYRNTKDLQFKNQTSNWGFLEPSFSNGAAYGDLDNDGDLDLVVNNIDEPAFVYKNKTIENKVGHYLKVVTNGSTSEEFAKITAISNGERQFIEAKRVKGYLSATEKNAYFGFEKEGTIDTLRVVWSSGKYEEKYNISVDQEVIFEEKDATATYAAVTKSTVFSAENNTMGINYTHTENPYNDFRKETLLPYKQSTLGPFITKADINGDGKEDIYVGGAAGQAGQLFVQTDSGFRAHGGGVMRRDSAHEDMEALFFDADNDGDNDLYVVSGGNEFEEGSELYKDRLYINDGSGNFSKSEDQTINGFAESGKSIAVIDFDKDGDSDLLVGNRIIPQKYPMPSKSYILRNDEGRFTEVTASVAPELLENGMVNQVLTTDFDNDGWSDFIVVGEWGGIGMYKNENGSFKNISTSNGLDQEKGLWFSISETDVNNDGLKDYLVGNMGTNIKFKASPKSPFKIFGNDFDDNGTYDIVLSNEYLGKEVPVRGRECSSDQMPFIAEKFQTYNEFANASLSDIYGDKLSSAYKGEITGLDSVILINTGDGNFTKVVLPGIAQKFPLLAAVFDDVNNDGFEDAIIAGNIYNTEVETPRLDMGSGIVLLGSDEGYHALPIEESGLYISGNAKSLLLVDHQGSGKKLLLSGRNNGDVAVIEMN